MAAGRHPPSDGTRSELVASTPAGIVGGVRVTRARWRSACALATFHGAPAPYASGVVIGPRVVLTAAHAAAEAEVVVSGEREVRDDSPVLGVQDRRVHAGRADLALLLLAAPAAAPPARLSDRTPRVGVDEVTIAGFGVTRVGGDDAGRLFEARVPVTWARGPGSGPTPPWPGARACWPGEWVAGDPTVPADSASGDSGCAAYRLDADEETVVGVTSRSATAHDTGGGIYVDVAAHLDWIRTTAHALAGPGALP